MKAIPVILVFLLVAGAILARGAAWLRPDDSSRLVEARAVTPGRDSDGGRPADAPKGVELVASLPKKVFDRGEAIELSLEFRNDSDSPVTFVECGFWPNHRVVVKDKQGHEAELTEEGRRRRTSGSDRSGPIVIKPGKSFDYGKHPVDLAPLYTLPPGDYTVRVTYDEPSPSARMKVSSKSIDFTVE